MDRNKVKLSVLLLMTALPISLATVMFYLREGEGFGSTTNRGTLITPVMDVTELDIRAADGRMMYRTFEEEVADIDLADYIPKPWLVVYLGGSVCSTACEERLYFLRQLHRRLGAEAARVNRLYLAVGAQPGTLSAETAALFATEFPDMKIAWADDEVLLANLRRTLPAGSNPISGHFIYIVDPVGNVMLYFTPDNSPDDILSDLQTLLDQTSLG